VISESHLSPERSEIVDRVTEADRLYFWSNPFALSRLRPYVPGEFPDLPGMPTPFAPLLTVVVVISSSLRLRVPVFDEGQAEQQRVDLEGEVAQLRADRFRQTGRA